MHRSSEGTLLPHMLMRGFKGTPHGALCIDGVPMIKHVQEADFKTMLRDVTDSESVKDCERENAKASDGRDALAKVSAPSKTCMARGAQRCVR